MTRTGSRLLTNSSFIFLLGTAAALALGRGAPYVEPALVPLLALIMTVSILDVSARSFLALKRTLVPVAVTLVLSYVVLSGVYIGLAYLLIDDPDIRSGFILIGAVPPAVAVVPLAFMLGGNTGFSLVGSVGAYIAALAITPLISLIFLGSNLIEPERLLIVLAELIVAPIVASRILRRTRLAAGVGRWREHIVNWGFFIVIYVIVGLNRDAFLQEPETLALPAAIAFTGIVVLTEVINRAGRLMGVAKADRVSLMLLGTRKNDGVAAAIALLFIGTRAAMPMAVVSTVSVIHFIWLAWWVRRMR